MADDTEIKVFGGLSVEEVGAIDFDVPVTRKELIEAMLTAHEALFAQVLLLMEASTGNANVPAATRARAVEMSGNILKGTGAFVRRWAGMPDAGTTDGE